MPWLLLLIVIVWLFGRSSGRGRTETTTTTTPDPAPAAPPGAQAAASAWSSTWPDAEPVDKMPDHSSGDYSDTDAVPGRAYEEESAEPQPGGGAVIDPADLPRPDSSATSGPPEQND